MHLKIIYRRANVNIGSYFTQRNTADEKNQNCCTYSAIIIL